MKRLKTGIVLSLLCCAGFQRWPKDLASFQKRVAVEKLANGLTVIVCRRPEAPVFSFATWVDAGSSRTRCT